MKEPPENIVASIQVRLSNKAKELGRPYGEILHYYGMERFLYRLAKTRYSKSFVLKGGLLFYIWNLPLRRPTKDIDFRGYLDHNSENIVQVIRDVIAMPVSDDGITFDPESVTAEETQIDADYAGVRAKFLGYLGRSRIAMQIDIGFSDEVTPKAEPAKYPTLFQDLEPVQIKRYPRESVISEKFHAIVHYGELNSRWKDYYDIWLICKTFELDGQSLQKALERTFQKRETELPVERPIGLTIEFANANNVRWKNFLKKFGLHNQGVDNFVNLVENLWIFLSCPIEISKNEGTDNYCWYPDKGWIRLEK